MQFDRSLVSVTACPWKQFYRQVNQAGIKRIKRVAEPEAMLAGQCLAACQQLGEQRLIEFVRLALVESREGCPGNRLAAEVVQLVPLCLRSEIGRAHV